MFQNMKSCFRTWNHVSEHDFMFQSMFMTQKHALCLRTWNHVHEHDFMFMNMISCSWTWSSRSDLVRPEHDFVMFKHVLNMPKHVLNIEHVFSCSELWTWSEHGGHLVDAVSMVWACSENFQASMSSVEQQLQHWFIGWVFNWINMVPVRFLDR